MSAHMGTAREGVSRRSLTGSLLGSSIMLRSTLRSLTAVAALASPLVAQETTPTIPLRQLGPVEAKTAQSLGNVNTVRALPDGRVFVNDGMRRQVLLFSPALEIERVVADTLEASIPYGQRSMGLMPYVADSTLLLDPATLSMLVLNTKGELVRVMAAPRSNDLNFLANANLGTHAFDTQGRLIYRLTQAGGIGGGFGGGGGPMAMMGGFGGGGRGGAPGGGRGGPPAAAPANPAGATARERAEAVREDRVPTAGNTAQITVGGERRTRSFNERNMPDSTPILRADFETRLIDTVAFMRATNPQIEMKQSPEGGMQVSVKMNPLPQNDDWALMKDGSVAVVRVLDYRIDWYKPDGTLERSAPLPFDWKRITDDEKDRMVDSLKIEAKVATERIEQMMAGGGGRGFRPSFEPVDAQFLPDYYPPIRAGSTVADYDGNLWVLPATSSLAGQLAGMIPAGARGQIPPGMLPAGMTAAPTAGLAYDVINRQGELVERVQLPAGRSIAGFGPDGVVYLTARQGREVFLEKVRRLPPQ